MGQPFAFLKIEYSEIRARARASLAPTENDYLKLKDNAVTAIEAEGVAARVEIDTKLNESLGRQVDV